MNLLFSKILPHLFPQSGVPGPSSDTTSSFRMMQPQRQSFLLPYKACPSGIEYHCISPSSGFRSLCRVNSGTCLTVRKERQGKTGFFPTGGKGNTPKCRFLQKIRPSLVYFTFHKKYMHLFYCYDMDLIFLAWIS